VGDCETVDECLHTKAVKLSLSDFITRLTCGTGCGTTSRKLRECRQVLSPGSCLRTREAQQESHDKYDICVHAGVVLVNVVAHLCVEEICTAEPAFGCLYIQVCSQNVWRRHNL